jgi:FAD:protein FMN transferase
MAESAGPGAAGDRLVSRTQRALGTSATVVVQDPAAADEAAAVLSSEVRAIDVACSRFRDDAEIQRVHDGAGRPVAVGALLFEALEVAVRAAARTGGAVDPTVGNAIEALGYDRDIDEVLAAPAAPPRALGRVAGWQHVQLDAATRTVRIPRGVHLDLGSTAKALAADRAAARIAARVGSGVLVSLGGDVSVAGVPPPGGWAVGIAQESSAPAERVDQVVAITAGGLASSAPSVRAWRSGGREVTHIVDPRTGDSVPAYWSLVSATGPSCVDANVVTTAALVWGPDALDKLAPLGQPARLVRADGRVFCLHGWPESEVRAA